MRTIAGPSRKYAPQSRNAPYVIKATRIRNKYRNSIRTEMRRADVCALSDRDRPTCTSGAGRVAAPPISPRSLDEIISTRFSTCQKRSPVTRKFWLDFCRGPDGQ